MSYGYPQQYGYAPQYAQPQGSNTMIIMFVAIVIVLIVGIGA